MLITHIIILTLVGCNNKADNDNNDNTKDLNISSMDTSLSSKDYPHTKAILTQQAKYDFIPIDPGEEFQGEVPDNYYGQMPNQNQQGLPPMFQQEPQWQERQAAPPLNYQEAPTQQERQDGKAPTPHPAPKQSDKTQTNGISQAAQQVIDLTNAERRKQGLPDLQADNQLSGVAQKKSDDMQQKHYFSHTSPTYGSPFDMMRDFGVAYKSAGENIAQGQQTPQEVVQAWMNSEGHRKNILSNSFTHIGVGYEDTGKHWTQMFIGK